MRSGIQFPSDAELFWLWFLLKESLEQVNYGVLRHTADFFEKIARESLFSLSHLPKNSRTQKNYFYFRSRSRTEATLQGLQASISPNYSNATKTKVIQWAQPTKKSRVRIPELKKIISLGSSLLRYNCVLYKITKMHLSVHATSLSPDFRHVLSPRPWWHWRGWWTACKSCPAQTWSPPWKTKRLISLGIFKAKTLPCYSIRLSHFQSYK